MQLGTYWVGQVPRQPLRITVYGEGGQPIMLDEYDEVNVRMLDSDNNQVDLSGGRVDVTSTAGTMVYHWPKNKSIFKRPGDYLVQLELKNDGVVDFTSPLTLVVRKFGKEKL